MLRSLGENLTSQDFIKIALGKQHAFVILQNGDIQRPLVVPYPILLQAIASSINIPAGSAAWGSILPGTGVASQTDLVAYLEGNYYPLSDNPAGYVTTSELTTTLLDYVTESALIAALSNYVTSSDLVTILSSYVTDSELTTALSAYVTTTALNTALSNYVPSRSSAHTASASAFLTIPVPVGYSQHEVTMYDVFAATINSELWLRVGIGTPSIIQSGGSDYGHYRSNFGTGQTFATAGSGADSKITLLGAAMPTGASGRIFSCTLTIYNPDNSTYNKHFNGEYSLKTSAGNLNGGTYHSCYNSNSPITSLRLLCNTGNISGTAVINSYL